MLFVNLMHYNLLVGLLWLFRHLNSLHSMTFPFQKTKNQRMKSAFLHSDSPAPAICSALKRRAYGFKSISLSKSTIIQH